MSRRRTASKKQKATRPNPDHNLAVEQFPQLNEEFYRAKPYDYFEQRLLSLMLMASDSMHVTSALRDGLSVGTLAVKNIERRPEEEATAYAATESIVLLHHTTEALFRLYFAHVGGPTCPWLEASRITFGGDFKAKVEQLLSSLDSAETRSDVLKVFRGTDTYKKAKANSRGTEEQWLEQGQGLIELLHLAGTRLVGEGPLYNAAKHGLTVVAAERGMNLDTNSDLAIARHGPSNRFLTANREKGRWEKKTTWVEVDATMGFAYLVIREIEALYNVARLRYLGQAGGRLPSLTPEIVRNAWMPSVKDDEVKIVVDTMSEELLYYEDDGAS
jgi:hypothetical protein